MSAISLDILVIPILTIILLGINLLLASHNPYQEKDSVFECGFHSFIGQNRTQFSISFFIFGLLFLLFDLEILLVYPYSVSSYINDIYGLSIMIVFFILLTLGFVFELGKNALTIDSRQVLAFIERQFGGIEAYVSPFKPGSSFKWRLPTIVKPYPFSSSSLESMVPLPYIDIETEVKNNFAKALLFIKKIGPKSKEYGLLLTKYMACLHVLTFSFNYLKPFIFFYL